MTDKTIHEPVKYKINQVNPLPLPPPKVCFYCCANFENRKYVPWNWGCTF